MSFLQGLPKEGLDSSKINAVPKDVLELEWTEVGTVKKLYIYPIKSGQGQSVKSAEVFIIFVKAQLRLWLYSLH